MIRRINFAAMVALGCLWAGLLIVGGALLAGSSPGAWPVYRGPLVSGGLTAVAAGLFVFLAVVADRLFPRRPHSLAASIETALAIAVIVGAACTVAFVLGDRP